MPIIRPAAAYVAEQLVPVDQRRQPGLQQFPGVRALATICSSSITESTASPAAMACALEPKLAECTRTRSMEE